MMDVSGWPMLGLSGVPGSGDEGDEVPECEPGPLSMCGDLSGLTLG